MKPFHIKHKRKNEASLKLNNPKTELLSHNRRQSSDIPDDTLGKTSTNFSPIDTRHLRQETSHLLSGNGLSKIEGATGNTRGRVRKVARGDSVSSSQYMYNSIESLHQQDYLKDTIVSSSV